MISNGQILAEIKGLKKEVELLNSICNQLIHGLRQDNRDLLNRLMSRHMLEYANTSPASVAEMNDIGIPARQLARSDEFLNEHLAGTVIENET